MVHLLISKHITVRKNSVESVIISPETVTFILNDCTEVTSSRNLLDFVLNQFSAVILSKESDKNA